jgi:hypothetical protein
VIVTRARTLAAVFALGLAIVFPVTGPIAEHAPQWLAAPWPLGALLVAVAAAVGFLAWPVRQFIRGKRRELDPLRAAATAAFAKACSLVGVGLAGAYAAIGLRCLLDWAAPATHERALAAGVTVLASILLAVAGQIGQLWCRVPPPQGPANESVE